MASQAVSDKRTLQTLSGVAHIFTISLAYAASLLPAFDTSHLAFNLPWWASPLLRWDAFHFVRIAESGYTNEYEWAFFPGSPIVMRYSGALLRYVTGKSQPAGWAELLYGGAISAALLCDTSALMYDLSMEVLGERDVAWMASLLSLLPSSPATLRFAAYTEPFFTMLSYRGMLACARRRWLAASFYFALATVFRSNGILLGGFILWGMVVEPIISLPTKIALQKLSVFTIASAALLTAIPFGPFLYHQYAAYRAFCGGVSWVPTLPISETILSILPPSIYTQTYSSVPILTESPTPVVFSLPASVPPPWCNNTLPFIYGYVQSTYWDVGFLRYWKLLQAPNFLLAAPPLALLFVFCIRHVRKVFVPQVMERLGRKKDTLDRSPFLSPKLTPHAIHALLMSSTLLFSAHVQIVLRVAASMPIVYWAAAWLIFEKPGVTLEAEAKPKPVGVDWGKWWIGWSLVWGTVSVVLWSTFLPPA